jgi:alanine-synthesizing transaminase
MSLIDRLPSYVFAVTDELKARVAAGGADLIDLSMGNPDGPAPGKVLAALVNAAQGPVHRYPNPSGTPELRGAMRDWYKRRYDVSLDPEKEILATLGAKEGIGHLLLALLSPGDAVIAPAPAYPIHHYGGIIAGARVVGAPVGPGIDFVASVKAAIEKAGTGLKGLICNFPHNPTGVAATPETFRALIEIAKARNLWIIHDLAYADCHFAMDRAPSFLAVPGARDVGVEFFSVSKSYNMAGFRVGFCAGNPRLVEGLARVKRYFDYGVFGPLQIAVSVALRECDEDARRIREIYRGRRDALVKGLKEIGWEIPPPQGTMFAWTRQPPKFRNMPSMDFAAMLIEKAHVAVSPGAGFGDNGEGCVRFALIQDEARTLEACRRMGKVIN